jgi:hypothetical protein
MALLKNSNLSKTDSSNRQINLALGAVQSGGEAAWWIEQRMGRACYAPLKSDCFGA